MTDAPEGGIMCPFCGGAVWVAEGVGFVAGRMLHLDCYITQRAIVTVILNGPTCLACLAEKLGFVRLDLVRTIERIRATVRIRTAEDPLCDICRSRLGPVYTLDPTD